jgi:hypothetical protein
MPQARHDATMAVDNDSVMGLDFSALPPNIRIIEWRDGVGEIELDALPQLRTNFQDITPYTPFFQQFMLLIPGISLAQAQKIQTDLITELYESKRQLPFHYAVAAGDFSWEATDAALLAMATVSIGALLGWVGGISFTPIGQGTPVSVSVIEMGAIMAGIASRRTSLLTTKFNKTAEVNALTNLTNVIFYDVTSGW